ncbi:DUF6318 family protein [Nesterenkonia halotolerans]|uniref:DUF6318 domain-containing protein n=1 Tax=Nesterenkonia halotolerans TaxID=225325 RepID=A0ABR9J4Z0_9MICC|nr:DUF6318 family protein [Nesterenkonia halotolerans]MBE1514067.1 hypothetical protein [Nesterenkonia halotolerans]
MNTSSGGLSAVGLAVVLVLSVSSCGGEDAGAEPDGTSDEPSAGETAPEGGSSGSEEPSGEGGAAEDPESSPTPVPASSDGPAENWPEPEIPEEIYEETEEGALAALRYWFDSATYLQLTGDPEPFEAMSGPDCVICTRTTEQFDEVYNVENAWHVTENDAVSDPLTSTITTEGDIDILFTLSESATQVYDSSGDQVLDHPGDDLEAEASLSFGDGSWLIEEVAFFPSEDG